MSNRFRSTAFLAALSALLFLGCKPQGQPITASKTLTPPPSPAEVQQIEKTLAALNSVDQKPPRIIQTKTVTLKLSGLKDSADAEKLKLKLALVPGMLRIKMDDAMTQAVIDYDRNEVSEKKVVEAAKEFSAEVKVTVRR